MDPMPLAIGVSNTALYKQIGSRLPKMTTAFLIGGENLCARGLRDDGRHDQDFVISNDKDFEVMVSTLTDIGFQRTTVGPQSKVAVIPTCGQEKCCSIQSLDWLMFLTLSLAKIVATCRKGW
jgi:hypothetical protein